MKQHLFARLNLPYYVHGPAYAEGSDEARALHHLCHALNLAGEEAYVTEEGDGALNTPRLTQERIEAHLRAGRKPIVIYPGSIGDNPLGADQVVRYLLEPAGMQTALGTDAREMLLARHTGLAAHDALLLAVPLADDAAYAASRNEFARQLRSFIDMSQRRFSPSFAPLKSTAPDAPPAPPAAARIFPGRLARPLGQTAAAAPTAARPPAPAKNRPPVPPPAPMAPAPVAPVAPPPPLFEGLKATPAAPASPQAPIKRKKRIVVYSVESTWSPCPQIRLIRPFAHLQDEWELIWGIRDGQLQGDYLNDADLIVLHRFTPGLMSIPTLQTIFASKVPIIYESDDLLNDIPHDHPEAQQGASWKEGIEYAVRNARAVVVSTEFLASKYRELNPAVHVLPNYIDFDMFYRPVPQAAAEDGKIRIGLLGSSIQPSNFALVDEALRSLVERYGQRLHIDFVGWECPKGWENHPLTKFHSFVHQYVDYATQLRQWNWDIALIPLASDEYNQCKSYIKWLDYSAAGIACIFSDVSVYNEVVTHDDTGLLMPNSSQVWLEAITLLIESPEKRHTLAAAGQQAVRAGFDLSSKAALYNTTYGQLTN
ncbi:glycosyltransferase family 4 protein [Herbaspirillum robiniae]|uniref:glycosyltransferase family 4 protein n=1 Tax=Herbaspirillum robiniae TaxID=2014887 RepID=UPI001FAFD5C4|nr:glycosyltransferase family 4 protein [Herbaspirillum robiniae]